MPQVYNFKPQKPMVGQPTSNFPGLKREDEEMLVEYVKSKNPELKGRELFAETAKAYTTIFGNQGSPLGKLESGRQEVDTTQPPMQGGLRRGSSRNKLPGGVVGDASRFLDKANILGKGFEKLDDLAQRIPTVSEDQVKQFSEKRLGGFGADFSKLPTMLVNAPGSLAKTATATARGVTNPIDTLAGLSKLLFTKEGRDVIVERYGTVEGFERAMTQDPVGVASDVLTVIQGGASIAGKGAKIAGYGKAADALSDISKTAGGAADLGISTGLPKALDTAIEKAPGGKVGKSLVRGVVAPTRPLQSAGEALNAGMKYLVDKKIIPDASETLQRLNRLKKSDQEKFSQQQGKNVGEWLNERGIVESPRGTVSELQDYFLKNKAEVDGAIDKLSMEGLFDRGGAKLQNKRLKLMVDDVVRHAENTESPQLDRMIELKGKYDDGGVSFKESNEIKRYFERHNKFAYGRDPSGAEKTQWATNIDNGVREFQIQKAEELGFANLRELNKETQAAKFIMDKLAKNTDGKLGNNYMTLTDWVVAAGASVEPSMLSALVAKKTFNSSWFAKNYAKIINKINGHEAIEAKVADLIELQEVKTPKQLDLFLNK